MTALPEAPEGCRWKVERTYSAVWDSFTRHTGYKVTLEKTVQREQEFTQKAPDPGFWESLLYIFKDAPKPVVETKTVVDFEIVPGSLVDIHGISLTPLDVSLAVKKSLKQVAERETIDALVGTYPPKSLILQETDNTLVYTEEELAEVKRRSNLAVIRSFMSMAREEGETLAEYMTAYLEQEGLS